jgi:integrase
VAPRCEFPALQGRLHHGLCDQHLSRFHSWRHHTRSRNQDPSVARYLQGLMDRLDQLAHHRVELPQDPVLALELRFVLQHRHDHGDGLIFERRWLEMLDQLGALEVRSLLDRDRDWWNAQRTGAGRVPRWMSYVNYAIGVLLAFRVRCGLQDAWAEDVWSAAALPIDEITSRVRTLDWRAIQPGWLRELCKRWARHRLRHGVSITHINTVRLAVTRLVKFCGQAGWPLQDPAHLTRELFEAFLDWVRGLDRSRSYRRQIAYGVKQLFEESHDFGWINLRHPRVYLAGEVPADRERLPRDLPPEITKRLNQPGALGLLRVDQRAAVLVLMDCGLRATDTARLSADALISGSDGAPYLRYWNHKRRREAIVPISDRAADAINTQRAWVQEHFPDCEWLFPRAVANGRGRQPMGYAFIWKTLARWAETLGLRDAQGNRFVLQAHAFRHTYATALVNGDVDLVSVQSLLDHDSPEMTWRYARLNKETLRRKWEQGQQRINIRGEVVPLDVDGDLSDAAWAKEQVARAKQSLPNGWCGLPLVQSCPHPNACLTCPAFLTDQTFLPLHREQLARTDQLIEHAKTSGNQRLVEINETTKVSLVAIIQRAEQIEIDNPIPAEDADA